MLQPRPVAHSLSAKGLRQQQGCQTGTTKIIFSTTANYGLSYEDFIPDRSIYSCRLHIKL